jgi:hypothetical protein
VNVVRYADDFVITGISKEILENEITPWIVDSLQQRIALSDEKRILSALTKALIFWGGISVSIKENYSSNLVRKTCKRFIAK